MIPKIEFFKSSVNGWKPLTNDTKSSILDRAGILDTPLKMYIVIGIIKDFHYRWRADILGHLCTAAIVPLWRIVTVRGPILV